MFKQTVFIVDDDGASAASLQALMMSHGCQAAVFSSAEEFLDGYDPSVPGCLVLDVSLEGMAGLELNRELIARGDRIPVILISGHADENVIEDAMANGVLAVLDKPFASAELFELVKKALASNVSESK